jgi:hypothetical protein
MKDITLYFPFYNQCEALDYNLKLYSSFNKKILNKLNLLIVDDGSQREHAFDVAKDYIDKLNLNLYRIDVDIPFNMPQANNIAFKETKTNWVIRSDIDHFLIEEEFLKISNLNLEKSNAYFFRIAYCDKEKNITSYPEQFPVHENIYIIDKSDYWKTGGSNEYLSGNYGDDFEFRPRLFSKANYIETDIHLYTIGNLEIGEKTEFGTGTGEVSYMPELKRDLSINRTKAQDPERPLLTFQNSYSKLI